MKGFSQKQQMKLKQNMFPILRTEIRLIQTPLLELNEMILEELEQNPLLKEDVNVMDRMRNRLEKREVTSSYSELSGDPKIPIAPDEEEEQEVDARWMTEGINFWQRIEAQLAVTFPENTIEGKIARELFDRLDGNGMLRDPVEDIANELGVPVEVVEEVRRELMRFDPPGVAARDIREVYLAQLDFLGCNDSILYQVVSDYWDKLDSYHVQKLINNLPDEEKERAREILKQLYPHPVNKYDRTRPSYVYPEVIIKIVEGRLVVELVESGIPKVTLNSKYLKMLDDPGIPDEAKRFIQERYKRALEFLEGLQKRKAYILRIAEFIAQHQKDFLMGKTKYLNPITQLQAAEELGIPPSTLNRIVNKKYADTPVGIFELKFFFSRSLKIKGENNNVSSDYLLKRIKELIESEDKEHPLRDEDIARILKEEGINISRRSISEKRSFLGIPSARKRKVKK